MEQKTRRTTADVRHLWRCFEFPGGSQQPSAAGWMHELQLSGMKCKLTRGSASLIPMPPQFEKLFRVDVFISQADFCVNVYI
jgi:hypothetical protein